MLEKAFSVRSTRMRSCKKNESYRSGSRMTQGIQENQPGVTMYQKMSMPVAAVAEAEKAAYHSHTAVAERRDDYRMVRQKVPGCALVISTGDPAFRFE
jgi:hypothetical protein